VALAQIKLYVNGASVAVMIGDQRGNGDGAVVLQVWATTSCHVQNGPWNHVPWNEANYRQKGKKYM
jgi:hypothetical protein